MKMSKADMQRLGEMAQPIARWLREEMHPHAKVEIDSGRVTLTEETASLPFHAPVVSTPLQRSSGVDRAGKGKLQAARERIEELETELKRWRSEHKAAVDMVERRDRTIIELRDTIHELEEVLHKRGALVTPRPNPADILGLLADLCGRAASDMKSRPGQNHVPLEALGDTIRKEHRALMDDELPAPDKPEEGVSPVRVLLWNKAGRGYMSHERPFTTTGDHTKARRMAIGQAADVALRMRGEFVEADAHGWVESWGEMPVGERRRVEVRYPDGSKYRGPAMYVDWRLARLFRLDPTPQAPDPSLAS